MKTFAVGLLSVVALTSFLCAQSPLQSGNGAFLLGPPPPPPSDSDPTYGSVKPLPDIGPDHHRIVAVSQVTDAQGVVHTQTSQYVQIENGLNRLNARGEWEETSDLIEIGQTNAFARGLRHKVTFAPNINTAEAIVVEMPGGEEISWNPIGISYYYAQSGNSVLLAQITNSIGLVIGRNQVVYTNCFEGLNADVRITVTRHGVEQDVVLHSQPASPESYGLSSDTTQIEIITEFVKAPVKGTSVERSALLSTLAALGKAAVQLDDERVDFGAMTMEEGQAFDVPSVGQIGGPGGQSPVFKRWTHTPKDNRNILYESLPINSVIPWLQELPHASIRAIKTGHRQQAAVDLPDIIDNPAMPGSSPQAKSLAGFPPSHQFARADYRPVGVLIDFSILGTNTVTNFTFQADTTYYVSGLYQITGTTTFEGGTVIKTRALTGSPLYNDLVGIKCLGKAVTISSPYRPVMFTAVDDNTVGESITNSNPSNLTNNWYGNLALAIQSSTNPVVLENLHFRYAYTTLQFYLPSNQTHTVRNVTLYDCGWGIDVAQTGLQVENALISIDAPTIGGLWRPSFIGYAGGAIGAVNVTVHNPDQLFYNQDGNTNNQLNVTNCLLVGSSLAALNNYSNAVSSVATTSTGVFQTAGSGAHYLVASSNYRNSGTTNISPVLANYLSKLTTYAPITMGNSFAASTVVGPTVGRDTDLPDLGYHYPPLDYLANQVSVTGALVLTNGVAIGFSGNYGFSVGASGSLTSFGLPNQPNVFTPINAVQELPGGGLTSTTNFTLINGPGQIFRFSDVSFMASTAMGRALYPTNLTGTATVQDSLLHCVTWTNYGNTATINLLDSTFERCAVSFTQGSAASNALTLIMQNCLLTYSPLSLTHTDPTYGIWSIYDNLFDNSANSVTEAGTGSYTNHFTSWGNNGFINCTNTLSGSGGNVTNLARDFVTGPFGNYYYPAPGVTNNLATNSLATLIDADTNHTVAGAGLYHFTTVVDQRKETNSPLDIGRHYVATEAYRASLGFSTNQGGNGWNYEYLSPPLAIPVGYSKFPNFGTNVTGFANTLVWYNPAFTYGDVYCVVWNYGQHPGHTYDSLRLFTLPHPGNIGVYGSLSTGHSCNGYDGTLARIVQNAMPITGWIGVPQGSFNVASVGYARGQAGDAIIFQINAGLAGENSCDATYWDPVVAYDSAIDTNGDGIPDYLQDFNGNGSVDSGETSWTTAGDLGFKIWITEPKPNSILP